MFCQVWYQHLRLLGLPSLGEQEVHPDPHLALIHCVNINRSEFSINMMKVILMPVFQAGVMVTASVDKVIKLWKAGSCIHTYLGTRTP